MTVNLIEWKEGEKAKPRDVEDPTVAQEAWGCDLTVLDDKDIKKLKNGVFLEVGSDGEYAHYIEYKK